MKNKKIEYNGNVFKSDLELYFALYLDELMEYKFVKKWGYEVDKFELSEEYGRDYMSIKKSKVIKNREHLLSHSSITPDFTIEWNEMARNIFFLDTSVPIECKASMIPFRLCTVDNSILKSYIEIKGIGNSSVVSSNISFPYKQKWANKSLGIYIQKIIPFSLVPNNNTLFKNTFYPKKVLLELAIYTKNTKYGMKGESKIKHDNVLTLNQYLATKTKFKF